MNSFECGDALRAQEYAFAKLADQYGSDAEGDFRRATRLVFAACLVVVVGAAGGVAALLFAAEASFQKCVTIAALCFIAGLPLWWQADRYRKSATENRRLQRHAATLEPYLSGFPPTVRSVMRASLAQRLFAPTREESDPLREPVWPSSEAFKVENVDDEAAAPSEQSS